MHDLQKRLLQLAHNRNLSKLKLREIGELLGEKIHPQRIKHHLAQLEKKGLITADYSSGKVKKVTAGTDAKTNILSIPILGCANCGPATMLAEENLQGYLKVSERFLDKTKDIFAIQAVGDSMNKASVGDAKLTIENGDYVIIDHADKTPNNNDYVLSVIDGLANIKKFVYDSKNDGVMLKSESTQEYPPIFIHKDDPIEYFVNGKVIQVIKITNDR
jgi:repressor LexA